MFAKTIKSIVGTLATVATVGLGFRFGHIGPNLLVCDSVKWQGELYDYEASEASYCYVHGVYHLAGYRLIHVDDGMEMNASIRRCSNIYPGPSREFDKTHIWFQRPDTLLDFPTKGALVSFVKQSAKKWAEKTY